MLASSQYFWAPVFEVPETPQGPKAAASPAELLALRKSQHGVRDKHVHTHTNPHPIFTAHPAAPQVLQHLAASASLHFQNDRTGSSSTHRFLITPYTQSPPSPCSGSQLPCYLCCFGDTHTAEPLAKSQDPFFPNIFFWTVRPSFNSGNDTARNYY